MAATYTKQGLLTGAGSMYLAFIETEDTPTAGPTYSESVFETPSLESINAQLEISNLKVHLSNIIHSDITSVLSATIPVTAGYFPRDFAEEAQGMVRTGGTAGKGGSWSMPTNPKAKPFRLAIPFTDENGDVIVVNFPKCTLAPVNIEGQTETDTVNPQMKTYNITATPILKPDANGDRYVLHKLDLADPDNKTAYDKEKLLEQGWYDAATLELCKLAPAG